MSSACFALQDVTAEVLIFHDAGDLLLDVLAGDGENLFGDALIIAAFM